MLGSFARIATSSSIKRVLCSGTLFKAARTVPTLNVRTKSAQRFLSTKKSTANAVVSTKGADLNPKQSLDERKPSATSSKLNLWSAEPVTLQLLESQLPELDLTYKILTKEEKKKIIAAHPLGSSLSKENLLPMHPMTGEIDFRFIEKPFFAGKDPILHKMEYHPPKDYMTFALQTNAGTGKTGSIFALAKKYYVLYVDASSLQGENKFINVKDELYGEFPSHISPMKALMKGGSSYTQTTLLTCCTQLLWLSQAILLHKLIQKYGKDFTPAIWIAYLTSKGTKQAAAINKNLQIWLAKNLQEDPDKDCGIALYRLQNALEKILSELTLDKVYFAIDEAQFAEHLFEDISIENLFNKKRSFLYVLAIAALPRYSAQIIAGSGLAFFDHDTPPAKETPINYYFDDFPFDNFPQVTNEEATKLVTQYFEPWWVHQDYLKKRVGEVAQGRLSRITNLMQLLWYTNKDVKYPFETMIERGIKALKDKIESGVFQQLDRMMANAKKAGKGAEVKRQLLELHNECVISSQLGVDEEKFRKLGVKNIEESGFVFVQSNSSHSCRFLQHNCSIINALVVARFVTIKEPLSFEVFRKWLNKIGYKPIPPKSLEGYISPSKEKSYLQ